MGKNFKTLFLSALTMVMTITLTACSNDENETTVTTSGFTEFSAGTKPLDMGDATRTSLDTIYRFFWENGDKIYVKKNNVWKESSTLNLTARQSFSKFTVNETFTASESSVDVIYIGQNGTVSGANASVTIAATQEQKTWNNATHLGSSGDCGTATATRDAASGAYNFTLTHKASYLIFYPYLDASMSGYNLTSIDIESFGGTELAGTFSFGAGDTGITGAATSGGTNKITLTLGTGGAGLPLQNTQPTKAGGYHCYAVICPGEHFLKITYHLQNATNATDMLDVTQPIGFRTFSPNGVSIIAHNMNSNESSGGEFDFTFENTYYLWDAKKWFWYGVDNYPTEEGEVIRSGWPTDPDDDRWWNTIPFTINLTTNSSASYSAKGMPCRNAISWYLTGGAYWDETTEWTIGGKTMTGGLWLKKWEFIEGKPLGSTIYNCVNFSTITGIVATIGRPDNSIINQYFFLPALGCYTYTDNAYSTNYKLNGLGTNGYYYSSSPNVSVQTDNPNNYDYAFGLSINKRNVGLSTDYARSRHPRVAGTRPDGTPWFQ